MGANNFNKNGNAGLTAAAGYNQFRDTIATPHFSNQIVGNVYRDSIIPMVTTGNYLDGIKRCGSSVGFKVEQKIKVFDYQENQTLDSQVPETSWRWLHINKAKYFNVKIDKITKYQICDFDKLTDDFRSSASKSLKERLDPETLLEMAVVADAANRGNFAGPEGNINMGSYGNELTVNPLNLTQVLVNAGILFTDQCDGSYWEDGKMVAILPNMAKPVFAHRDSGLSGVNPQTSTGENGDVGYPNNLTGWKLVFTNNVPRVRLAGNDYAYYVIFAHKDATGFVQQIEEHEIKDAVTSFGQYYRGLWVYGSATLIPEAVAVGFFKFDATVI